MAKTKGAGVAKIVNPKDLEAMAAAGMTPIEIAKYYGLTRQGMVKVIERNPELQESFSNGLHIVLLKCVRCLIDKVEKGSSFEAIYLLNNRFKWMEEKYRKEEKTTDHPVVQIYLPDNNRNPVIEEVIE